MAQDDKCARPAHLSKYTFASQTPDQTRFRIWSVTCIDQRWGARLDLFFFLDCEILSFYAAFLSVRVPHPRKLSLAQKFEYRSTRPDRR